MVEATTFEANIYEYHQRPSISSSALVEFSDDPLLWWQRRKGLADRQKETPAMRFGTDVHRMIELGGWAPLVAVYPDDVLGKGGRRGTNACKEWEAEHAGYIWLKSDDPNPYADIWDNLQAWEGCKPYLEARKEVNVEWIDDETGLQLRCRVDSWVNEKIIADWKTAADVSPQGFQRYAYWGGKYHLKAAFYQMGIEALTGERQPFVAIAIKNTPSHSVQPYEIDPDWIFDARAEVRSLLNRMAKYDGEAARKNVKILTLSAPAAARFQDQYEMETDV